MPAVRISSRRTDMVKRYTYTKEFAEAQWIAFSGEMGVMIKDHTLSASHFASNPKNWASSTGKEYPKDQIKFLLQVIRAQRMRLEALFMVEQGRARSFDHAKAILSGTATVAKPKRKLSEILNRNKGMKPLL